MRYLIAVILAVLILLALLVRKFCNPVVEFRGVNKAYKAMLDRADAKKKKK